MQGDLQILYALMGVVIFLALMAAIGAWVRGGGLKRDDAENLFSDSQERHREEVMRLEKIIEETRLSTEQAQARAEEALAAKLRELDEHVERSQTNLQSAVTQAAYDQGVSISKELEVVSSRLSDSERKMTETLAKNEQRMVSSIADVNQTLQTVQVQVNQAGDQIRSTLVEINRQQREQKAQSTIQLCEALITSLGTLKSSISNQLIENAGDSARTVEASESRDEIAGPDSTESETDIKETDTASDSFADDDEEQYTFDEGRPNPTPFSDASTAQSDDDTNGIRLEDDTAGQASYNPETGESSFASGGQPDEAADQEPRAFNYGDAALSSEESNTEDEDANQHHI